MSSLEHDDNEGVEARLFSYCLQEVTESVGPYKIFGSREVNAVGSCVNRFVNAVVKAHKGIDLWMIKHKKNKYFLKVHIYLATTNSKILDK